MLLNFIRNHGDADTLLVLQEIEQLQRNACETPPLINPHHAEPQENTISQLINNFASLVAA